MPLQHKVKKYCEVFNPCMWMEMNVFIVSVLLRLVVTSVATPNPAAGEFRQFLGPVQYGAERNTLTIMIRKQ